MNDRNISDNRANYCCHVCGQLTLEIVQGYEKSSQVTSDCKPWPAGNNLCVCRDCGSVQKLIDQKWRDDAKQIYRNYSIYHQGGGAEQAVFDKNSGKASSRSTRLLECFKSNVNLPTTGRILDVGCGNGGLLHTFAGFFPRWQIAGTEHDDRYRKTIENITVNSTLYTCPLEDIPETFELITMLHILEHILDPLIFLRQIKNRLKDDGLLVVDVPDYQQNPFDLLIADHCTHFTFSTLKKVMKISGFSIVKLTSDWIPKEISLVVRRDVSHLNGVDIQNEGSKYPPLQVVNECLKWLDALRQQAKEIAASYSLGIFGTSIAATWLFSEMGGMADFFVDEDLQRISRTYMGRTVYHPHDIPKGSHVFLALPPTVAQDVFRRLSGEDIKYHLPPLLKI